MPGEETCGEQQLQLLELLAVLGKPLEGLLLSEELPDCCCSVGEVWNEKKKVAGRVPGMI